MKIQELDKYIKDTKKKKNAKKKKGKRKFGNKHYKNPEFLLKHKALKKYGKDGYEEELFKGFEALGEVLKKLFNDKDTKVDLEDLIDALSNKKVMKAFINVLNEYLDSDQKIPEVYMFLISELYMTNSEVKDDEKSFKKLIKIFETVEEEKIDTLRKALRKSGCDKKTAKKAALQFALLSADYQGLKKKSTNRIIRFFRELYKSFNEGEVIKYKLIKSIIHACYGKKMGYVANILLLDKAQNLSQLKTDEEREVYSMVTNVTLDFIKKMDRDDMKTLLKKYAKARLNNLNTKRRVNLYSGLSDDYSKITKVIDRMVSNGAYKKEVFE